MPTAIQPVMFSRIGDSLATPRTRRVLLALGALALLSLGDLRVTLLHFRGLGIVELNPIGQYFMASHLIGGLILWKLGATGLSVGLLLKVRRHTIAEAASWLLLGLMIALTCYWYWYTFFLSRHFTVLSYHYFGQALHLSGA